jgi:hypothetical protein
MPATARTIADGVKIPLNIKILFFKKYFGVFPALFLFVSCPVLR